MTTTATKASYGEHELRAELIGQLDAQRAHVLGIVEGLSDEQLRTAVLPSGWSCLEMLSHLTYDVEHYWFACIMGGSTLGFFDRGGDDARYFWHVDEATAPPAVLAGYRDAIEASNAVIGSLSLGDPPRQRSEWWGSWDVASLCVVLLHVTTETACHAGHLDATRELLDGRQWVLQ